MEKEKIISIISDIIKDGYTLDGVISLADDTCATFKRKKRWIYPDRIYVTSFIDNSFLFSSNEFNYRFNLSGKTLSDQLINQCDSSIVSVYEDDELTEEELEEIDAEIERAIENDELYIWDEIALDIVWAIINNHMLPFQSNESQSNDPVPEQTPVLLQKIADFSSHFRQLLFFSGF